MTASALALSKKRKPTTNRPLRVAAERVLDLGTTSGAVVFLTAQACARVDSLSRSHTARGADRGRHRRQ